MRELIKIRCPYDGSQLFIFLTGAFGRRELSTLFKKSFLSEIIHEHQIPVFVAHK
jgi:hypothetical protein